MAVKSQSYEVQVNVVFVVKAKDRMQALDKVARNITTLAIPGCTERELKFSSVKEKE